MELFCFELEGSQWEALQEELARADTLRLLTLARCKDNSFTLPFILHLHFFLFYCA